MSIRVHHPGNDLFPEGVVEYLEGDRYEILDDHTVQIYDEDGNVAGHIHPEHWANVSESPHEVTA